MAGASYKIRRKAPLPQSIEVQWKMSTNVQMHGASLDRLKDIVKLRLRLVLAVAAASYLYSCEPSSNASRSISFSLRGRFSHSA